MTVKPEGKRRKVDQWIDGWLDNVEKDLRKLGVVSWRAKAQERNGWRKFLEQAKTHKGLRRRRRRRLSAVYSQVGQA
jgi:hypothetical protein